jgi:hypothetical protein
MSILAARGIRKRVSLLMLAADLAGVSRRKFFLTTVGAADVRRRTSRPSLRSGEAQSAVADITAGFL